MHIKQVSIHGFKTYKDQILVDSFSPKHSVIVGRNGSGKSNFFSAIRFVLGDSYNNMTKEERQALLHEGTGAAAISAYVEIIFDNTDQRFPTQRDEMILRRTIGLKKDEYSLDKKPITKTEVMSLLESAGFSRSNPYYIVPQGRITMLTNAKDAERLQLLKEVAGTRVYEEKREESLKIVDETASKREKIDESLEYIEERLKELQQEKDELKEFEQLDKERRALQYTIYDHELSDLNEKLKDIESVHVIEIQNTSEKQTELQNLELQIAKAEDVIKEQKQKSSDIHGELNHLEYEKQTLTKSKAQLELRVHDLEEAQKQTKEDVEQKRDELDSLEEQIKIKEQELQNVITPTFRTKLEEESRLRTKLKDVEGKSENLFAKQGRNTQFNTKEERDVWINQKLQSMRSNLKDFKEKGKDILEENERSKNKVEQLNEEIVDLKNSQKIRKNQIDENKKRSTELESLKERLEIEKKETWRKETELLKSIRNSREEQQKHEGTLNSSVSRDIVKGLDAVNRIRKRDSIDGVYGSLYELFKVDEKFYPAVEVAAGNSLFYVVVENDDIATTILEKINIEKSGRVTFIPLNRVRVKETTYPDTRDVIPMVKKLKYDQKFEKAIQQIFGKYLICRDLQSAGEFSKKYDINCITIDGDQVNKRGALTGGFHDAKRSRLDAAKSLSQINEKIERDEREVEIVKSEAEKKSQEIARIMGEIQKCQNTRKQLVEAQELSHKEISSKTAQLSSLRTSIDEKQKSLKTLELELQLLEQQTQSLEGELGTDLTSQLSELERQILSSLTREADSLRNQLAETSKERFILESKKNAVTAELEDNLRRRRNEIEAELELQKQGDLQENFVASKKELNSTNVEIQEINDRQKNYEQEIEVLTEKLNGMNEELNSMKKKKNNLSESLQNISQNRQKFSNRRAVILQERDQVMRKIRDLGSLPTDSFEKFKGKSLKLLTQNLHKVNEKLKKYDHVNKKAYEQYRNFTEQRDSLIQRKEELDSSAKAIEKLIQSLDMKKDEAIHRTFKQVAKNFAEVFTELVPSGKASLIMQRRADQQEGDPQEKKSAVVEQYIGVGIKVTFDNRSQESQFIQQLSGGQKSLVTLALIFAIQKCDPAPFYLFDEIDANLDSAHRVAVANMIHRLSESAQFITTTFRPELLANSHKYYGVTFANKVSSIQEITKEKALDFIEREIPGN